MASKQEVIAEVYDAKGGPAKFRELRVETESTNEAGETILRKLGSRNYYPEAENRYTFRYILKRPDASIWLVLVDDLGETKKQIIPGKRSLLFRSEVSATSDEVGGESTKGTVINYTYNIAEVDMSQHITNSPGAMQAGRDIKTEGSNKGRQSNVSDNPPPNPPHSVPAWFAKAGFVLLALTALSLFYLLVGPGIPSDRKVIFNVWVALCVAGSAAFLGGDAVAKGTLRIPFMNNEPLAVTAVGGIGTFIVVLVILESFNS
jgi:hypothetical protein